MKTALILSPFATDPEDAGQRKRTKQVTALLRAQGYRITFLFYAFEGPWYHGCDEAALSRMAAQWDEVIHFPADRSVGLPPRDGVSHALDEWWSEELGQYLTRLFSRRHFDALVVHNVWLSKAFDFCPPNCVKVLETHDLFWLRNKYYAAGDVAPEFYVINQASELDGLRRADLIVTIQSAEFDLLSECLPDCAILNIPYVTTGPCIAADYRSPDLVSFGVMGTDHAFNVAGLKALLACLEEKIKASFAPVEVVVAGRLSERVDHSLAIEAMGYVRDEHDFYDRVDFVLAPVFCGHRVQGQGC